MKKKLLFSQILLVLLLVGISSTGWSQILYEGFNYATPAYIGGNGEPGATSNNWVTHNVTAGETTTIDLENGSLTYPGLANPTGNKVFLYSNANKVSRDVNRAFSSTATTLYYSVLVNIIDNSQINTFDNYFMHFGATAGAVNATFGGRLGVRSVGTPTTNFRFIIANTSGGTPVYSDNGADLNFGTTYLVVVKYNISAALTVATMWVNPTSLGGAEPTGGISNSTGTNAITTFASICLRNNATTPKAYIDEIRVGETWASVTPAGVAPLPKLVITEIMYNSPESTDEEWFELYNSGTTTVDMSGFIMSDSDTAHLRNPYVFPAGSTIAAGKYFTAQMSSGGVFPFVPGAVLTGGPFNLGNSGDQVKIYTKEKLLIDSVQYTNAAPWPTATALNGASLTLCDPTKDNSLAANWSVSTESFATLQGGTIKASPGTGCVITGIPNKLTSDLAIYPNPASERIYSNNPENELFDIVVFSSLGKPVKSIQSKQSVLSVDLGDLPKGLYVVKLTSKAGKYSKVSKVILK